MPNKGSLVCINLTSAVSIAFHFLMNHSLTQITSLDFTTQHTVDSKRVLRHRSNGQHVCTIYVQFSPHKKHARSKSIWFTVQVNPWFIETTPNSQPHVRHALEDPPPGHVLRKTNRANLALVLAAALPQDAPRKSQTPTLLTFRAQTKDPEGTGCRGRATAGFGVWTLQFLAPGDGKMYAREGGFSLGGGERIGRRRMTNSPSGYRWTPAPQPFQVGAGRGGCGGGGGGGRKGSGVVACPSGSVRVRRAAARRRSSG
jgi:hypothetical protein